VNDLKICAVGFSQLSCTWSYAFDLCFSLIVHFFGIFCMTGAHFVWIFVSAVNHSSNARELCSIGCIDSILRCSVSSAPATCDFQTHSCMWLHNVDHWARFNIFFAMSSFHIFLFWVYCSHIEKNTHSGHSYNLVILSSRCEWFSRLNFKCLLLLLFRNKNTRFGHNWFSIFFRRLNGFDLQCRFGGHTVEGRMTHAVWTTLRSGGLHVSFAIQA
jgi:hypothetical protein